jgi:hypothetical protein
MGQVNFELPDDSHDEVRRMVVDHPGGIKDVLPQLVQVGLQHKDEVEGYDPGVEEQIVDRSAEDDPN